MNDTGLEVLTLFTDDLLHLGGNVQIYRGWVGEAYLVDANGMITVHPRVHIQVQLVRDDKTPESDWVDEVAIDPSSIVFRFSTYVN